MNGNGESNEIAKKIIKKAIMAAAKPLIIGILIFAIVLIALSSILNFLTVLDGTPQDSDWSNVPYAKSQYVKNISIDNDGKITTKMSIDEIAKITYENAALKPPTNKNLILSEIEHHLL